MAKPSRNAPRARRCPGRCGVVRIVSALGVALLASTLVATAPATGPLHDCTGPAGVHELVVEVDGEPATGRYALPTRRPDGLTVIMHGYVHDSLDWEQRMLQLAARDRTIVLAMDYRGTVRTEETVRGWQVNEGAADSIAAAQQVAEQCGLDRVAMFAVSMGANAGGIALAQAPTHLDGTTPLFDVWFAIEPLVDPIETWHGASALAGFDAFAAQAKQDMEAQFGGTPYDATSAWADGTPLLHLSAIASSGIEGAVVVSPVDDGLATHNQARSLYDGLLAAGTHAELITVGRRDDQSDPDEDTTLTGYALGAVGVDPGTAGHASEQSETHIVMRLADERLAAWWEGKAVTCGEGVEDDAGATHVHPGCP